MSGKPHGAGDTSGGAATRRGRLFILSAPSGAGKSTLCKRLRARFGQLRYSISHTTRLPRRGKRVVWDRRPQPAREALAQDGVYPPRRGPTNRLRRRVPGRAACRTCLFLVIACSAGKWFSWMADNTTWLLSMTIIDQGPPTVGGIDQAHIVAGLVPRPYGCRIGRDCHDPIHPMFNNTGPWPSFPTRTFVLLAYLFHLALHLHRPKWESPFVWTPCVRSD